MTPRTRRGFLYGLAITSGTAAGCSAAGTVTAQDTPIGDSRMDQYDAGHSGYAPSERGPRRNPQELWHFDTDGALVGSAAVVDNVAYTADETGTVRALDAGTGTERWAVGLGEDIVTSPVVAGETVYVAAGESLYALAVSDGAERWVEVIGADPSSPVAADGMVIVAGGDSVHVFTPDGTSATTAELTGDMVSTPAVVGSTLYAATDSGTVYAFDIDQSNSSVTLTEQWTISTVIDRRPTVTVSDGPLVVTGASPGESEQGRVYALNAATGAELWEFTTTNWIESPAAIDGDAVYVGGTNGDVVALTAESGTERWRFTANDSWSVLYWGPGVTGGSVVTDDTVYVGSEDDNLYAIDAESGTPQWQFSTGDAIVSTPTVVDGIAFIGSTDGALYAITSPETSPVPLDADTSGDGAVTDSDAQTTDGGVLGFSLASGARRFVTSPVSLLVLAIGLLYGIVSIASNESDDDAASTGPAVEVESVPVDDTDTASAGSAAGDGTTTESPGSVASEPSGGTPTESAGTDTTGESQHTVLLDELRELDAKWSEIDRTLLYSVGDHHPDEYVAVFGSLDAALAAADVTDTATTVGETGADTTGTKPTGGNSAEDDTSPANASEQDPQVTHLRDQLVECESIADHLVTQLSGALPDTSSASETHAASSAAEDAGDPVNSGSTATDDAPPTAPDASDQPIDSERDQGASRSRVRTTDGIDETAQHSTPLVLQIREHLTEDSRRHVFRAETVDGASVQLDVWHRHVGEFDWEPDTWYVFESVRGQHWTVDGESGVTVSTTPAVTITQRDSLPGSDVPTG